jgi:hypothetical protein
MANLALVNQVLFNGQSAATAKYIASSKVVDITSTTYSSNYFDVIFSANLIASNSVAGTVNGVSLTATVFATSNAATLAAVAVKIAAVAGVAGATALTNSIRVYPSSADGIVALTSFAVTLGASQATVTYGAGSVNSAVGTSVLMVNLDGSATDILIVSNTVAAVRTALNAATTTNNVNVIPITVKNIDGTTSSINVNIGDIWWTINDPKASADGILAFADTARDRMIVVTTDENAAAIAALANA